jgi:hypothetical protein
LNIGDDASFIQANEVTVQAVNQWFRYIILNLEYQNEQCTHYNQQYYIHNERQNDGKIPKSIPQLTHPLHGDLSNDFLMFSQHHSADRRIGQREIKTLNRQVVVLE